MNIYAKAIQIYEESQDHAKLLLEVLKNYPSAIVKAYGKLPTNAIDRLSKVEREAREIALNENIIKAVKFLRYTTDPPMKLKDTLERVKELKEII